MVVKIFVLAKLNIGALIIAFAIILSLSHI